MAVSSHPGRRDVLALAAGLLAGCGGRSGPPEPEPLRIAAASDLQHALPILVAAFRVDHPIPVEPTFGSSGQLAEQVAQGAPFDLFLSANLDFVRTLARSGAIRPDSVREYARGSLVMVVHPGAGVEVRSIADLDRPEIRRIAIANPDLAPYGLAARQALEHARLWDRLEPKIVRAESVRQAFQFVATGNAEVGFVGRALAGDRNLRVVPVDPDAYAPIIQGLGCVARSRRAAEAEAFARFLLGEAGQALLVELGFSRRSSNSAG
ncbi:molybdate ABC transporter substrate-binding protein [Tundrisphaera sp. TA3]|uniref:molybdate ABC transporter substrate-binding protein n=1 Tax=Tundrisphaera sp. TA3 TaxID=3435775 RepID=UPI003EB82500